MCFVIAFAAPGLMRFFGTVRVEQLFLTWFAAHFVHFASVAVLFETFVRPRLVQSSVQDCLGHAYRI